MEHLFITTSQTLRQFKSNSVFIWGIILSFIGVIRSLKRLVNICCEMCRTVFALPSRIRSTFSKASSTLPLSSFLLGLKKDWCWMASWVKPRKQDQGLYLLCGFLCITLWSYQQQWTLAWPGFDQRSWGQSLHGALTKKATQQSNWGHFAFDCYSRTKNHW